MFELSELMKKADRVIAKENGINMDGGKRIEEGLRAQARSLIERDMMQNQNFSPLNRLQDRRTLRPWQGKESDAEVAFNFESLTRAQDLYDFVTGTGMLEDGEVKLKSINGQHSVHFMSHVMVMKPDVIQAIMMANAENVAKESVESFNKVAENITTVLHERAKCKKKNKNGEVKLDHNESLAIEIIAKMNEEVPRAKRGDLKTRYWENLDGVGEGISSVLRKLPNRQEITREDAADVIGSVRFLGDNKDIVSRAKELDSE